MQKKKNNREKRGQRNLAGKQWRDRRGKPIKIALVYDRVNKFGGAERVLLALHTIFPSAPLFTSVYHPKKAPWANGFTIYPSFLQRIPFAKSFHQLFAPLMPLAFASFSFQSYDVVISVTSESAKGIRVPKGTLHICLCLSPTRYLWSGYEEYFSQPLLRFFSKPLIAALRVLDKKAAKNPHAYIAISKEVQKRIKKYYNRDSEVIYPPLMLRNNSSQRTRSKQKSTMRKLTINGQRLGSKKYFLVVSRLSHFTPYKRIDIAIKAASKLNIELIVVGQGNSTFLKKYAGPHVTFVEKATDSELIHYYKNATALIFPGKEDFGLVMAEAISFGTPVIAYKAGGALEIVEEGKTGTFFARQTVSSLTHVLKNFHRSSYNTHAYKENTKRFSFSYFEKSLKAYILKALHSSNSGKK